MRNKENDINHYTNYAGLVVIYLVTVGVAATVILPSEEYWYFGLVKSLLWPFYSLTKLI